MVKRVKAWFETIYMWLFSFKCCKKSQIMNSKETIDYAINNRKTIIRYGDGEFFLMHGDSIHYQIASESLMTMLKKVIDEYCDFETEYMLCLPNKYFMTSGWKLISKRVLMRSWVRPRYIFRKKYDKENVIYGDAFLFSKENVKEYDRLFDSLKGNRVVFVHNNKQYADLFEEKYNIQTIFVHVPAMNAYEKKETILNDVLKIVKKNDVVLISAGPCAKYLAYELAKKKIWTIDTGHCWDEPLEII